MRELLGDNHERRIKALEKAVSSFIIGEIGDQLAAAEAEVAAQAERIANLESMKEEYIETLENQYRLYSAQAARIAQLEASLQKAAIANVECEKQLAAQAALIEAFASEVAARMSGAKFPREERLRIKAYSSAIRDALASHGLVLAPAPGSEGLDALVKQAREEGIEAAARRLDDEADNFVDAGNARLLRHYANFIRALGSPAQESGSDG